jgi:hypothetical protein
MNKKTKFRGRIMQLTPGSPTKRLNTECGAGRNRSLAYGGEIPLQAPSA